MSWGSDSTQPHWLRSGPWVPADLLQHAAAVQCPGAPAPRRLGAASRGQQQEEECRKDRKPREQHDVDLKEDVDPVIHQLND